MAPHAGTAGLKVLLAGASQLDLGEAQAFLSGEGAVGMYSSVQLPAVRGIGDTKLTRRSRCTFTVTISLSRYETAKLLQTTDFDVAVVEVRMYVSNRPSTSTLTRPLVNLPREPCRLKALCLLRTPLTGCSS